MGKYDEEQLKQVVERLIEEVWLINEKFELYYHLLEAKREWLEELNVSPAFFQIVMSSLLTDTIVSLSRMYEPSRRSDFNLQRFFDVIEKSSGIIEQGVIDQDLIDSHRETIKEKGTLISNLMVWRDKRYAHFDKKYFLEDKQLSEDARLTYGDIRDLIKTAEEIANRYLDALSGTVWAIGWDSSFDVDKIFKIIRKQKKM